MAERLAETILWIARGDESGGVGRSLLSVAEVLEEVNLKVRLAALTRGRLVDLASTFGIETVVAAPSPITVAVRNKVPPSLATPASLLLARPFGWPRAVLQATHEAGWRDVRAIHVRSPALLSLGGLVAQQHRVPLIWQIANAPGTERSVNRLVYRWAVRRWRAHPLANSRYVSNRYEFLGDIPWAYVPIEASFHTAALTAPQVDTVRFLSIGRISLQKGQGILVSAFERFLDEGGSGRLRIVGLLDDDASSEDLRRRVATSPRRDSIELVGYTENPLTEFECSHILIAGQVHQEPFGQVAAQGLAMGRPVLAIGRGGPAELVEATGFGWHVHEFEASSIKDGMSRAAQDYERVAAQAIAARRQACTLLHPKRFQKAYCDLLQ
jgi:glycosyltransferase involved in cell wall biosynthesis